LRRDLRANFDLAQDLRRVCGEISGPTLISHKICARLRRDLRANFDLAQDFGIKVG
jgi:hypothetical protein